MEKNKKPDKKYMLKKFSIIFAEKIKVLSNDKNMYVCKRG